MRRARLPVFAASAILTIASCSGGDPVAEEANAAANLLPTVDKPAADPAGAAPAGAGAEAKPLAAAAAIPRALHGRWGLAPGDCTSTRGDAKGLLVIAADQLRFYESVAVPAADIEKDADSISGNFAFSGEGQSWTKYQALKRQGQKLLRTETQPTASFTYARC